jgi:hypothetical protein
MAIDDYSSIINVINLYAVAVDSHRYDLFERVFADDIHCDFGGGAAFTDRATLQAVFKDIHAVFSATQHIVSGHAITLEGDTAHCFSYVSARFRRGLEDGEGLFQSTGWYDDVLTRAADGWRIRERTSRMVSYGGDVRVMQAMPGVDTDYVLLSLAEEAEGGRIRFLSRI